LLITKIHKLRTKSFITLAPGCFRTCQRWWGRPSAGQRWGTCRGRSCRCSHRTGVVV